VPIEQLLRFPEPAVLSAVWGVLIAPSAPT
jgi:hypothetical protein